MSNIYKILFLVFVFFVNSNSFSQNLNEYERQKFKNESFDYENLEPLYIGNFLSSIVASKNRDYKKFLSFSEKALKSNNNNIELLENAFWANVYLGNINRALEITSDIELISNEDNQDFLFPTIIELLRRNELSSYEIILFLGDNLGDFHQDFFGKDNLGRWGATLKHKDDFGDKFILFPNLIYGNWEEGFEE